MIKPAHVNLAIILGGGTVFAPVTLQGLGSEASSPSAGFVLVIFLFAFLGGLVLFLWDLHAKGETWAKPSPSLSIFGPEKQAQLQFISGLGICWHGIVCMLAGGAWNANRVDGCASTAVRPGPVGIGACRKMDLCRTLFRVRATTPRRLGAACSRCSACGR